MIETCFLFGGPMGVGVRLGVGKLALVLVFRLDELSMDLTNNQTPGNDMM